MHIKFLAYGTGDPSEAVAYLLGTHDHNGRERAEVRVLRGDPALVGALASSLKSVHRYTSGVIAWHPDDDPTEEEIEDVLRDYERTAFAGLEPDQYAFSAILHVEHDGSKHLHLFAARVELRSGKAFNMAPPGWMKSFDPLRDAWNHEKGWARPDDPARARLVQPGPLALVSRSTAHRNQATIDQARAHGMHAGDIHHALDVEPDQKRVIAEWLMEGVCGGRINNRQDVLNALAELGEINRVAPEYVSVRLQAGGKPVRLKGVLFSETFDGDAVRKDQNTPKHVIGNPRALPNLEAAAAARVELEAAIQRRAAYNKTRYCVPSPSAQRLTEDVEAVGVRVAACKQQQARDAIQAIRVRTALASLESGPNEEMPHDRDRNDAVAAAQDLVARVRAAVRTAGRALERLREAALAAIQKDRGLVAIGRALDSAVERLERATRVRGIRREEELTRFNREINLVEVAQSAGYEIDLRASTRTCTVMKRGTDKIVVGTDMAGHGIYFSVGEEGESGSIIDFVQRRLGVKRGMVRRALRGWLDKAMAPSPKHGSPENVPERPTPVSRDRVELLARWHRLEPYQRGHLTTHCGLDPDLVSLSQARQDRHGNACFGHFDRDGLCGWEQQNVQVAGFSDAGQRGLALVRLDKEPTKQIVVAEFAIDALSWAQLHQGPAATAYASLGGRLEPHQIELLIKAARRHGASLLVLGTDTNSAGNDFATRVERAVSGQVAVLCDRLPLRHTSWNEALLARAQTKDKSPEHRRVRA